jgi:hypothetical protein
MTASSTPETEKVVVTAEKEASPPVSSGNDFPDGKKEGLDVEATEEEPAPGPSDFSAYFVSYS